MGGSLGSLIIKIAMCINVGNRGLPMLKYHKFIVKKQWGGTIMNPLPQQGTKVRLNALICYVWITNFVKFTETHAIQAYSKMLII